MTLKSYSWIMSSASLLTWLFWFASLWLIDPMKTNWIGLLIFYSSLFLSVMGTASLLGFYVRFIALKQAIAFRLVRDAFRQSFLFSFLIVASLILLSKDLFSWINVSLLVAGLSVLEFFLLGLGGRQNP